MNLEPLYLYTKSICQGNNKMRIRLCFAVILLSMLVIGAHAQEKQATTNPREQLQQYITQLQAKPTDDALRTKIIQLVLALEPKPAVQPEVDELAGRGEYILQHATTDADLPAAADAFAKASLLAPWVPDYYFDQGIVWEKAKVYQKAIKNFELYLIGVPADSDDARKARQHLGGVKYALEQQETAETAQRQQEEVARERYREQQRNQDELQNLWSGVWRVTGGTEKDPRFRGSKIRWDSYHESHLMFKVSGDQISKMGCFDRADYYQHVPGNTWSETGQLSGRTTANFSRPFGGWAVLQINDQGDIEQRDDRYPGEVPWVYSRVNDPGAISPSCSQ